jgi:hypothetical protein
MNYRPYVVTQFSHIFYTYVTQLLDLPFWLHSPGSDTISSTIPLYTLINTRTRFRNKSTKQSPTLVPVLSYVNPVNVFPLHFCMINVSMNMLSNSTSSNRSLAFRLPYQNPTLISHISHACHLLRLSFSRNNIWLGGNVMCATVC